MILYLLHDFMFIIHSILFIKVITYNINFRLFKAKNKTKINQLSTPADLDIYYNCSKKLYGPY